MNTLMSQMQAINFNNISIPNLLQQLQTGNTVDVYNEDEEGRTLLMYVCMTKHQDTALAVKYLLARHALLDQQDNSGKTAIHYAAEYNTPEVLKVLLTSPADFINREAEWDLPDNEGRTALFYSSAYNVKILLDACSSPTHIDRWGWSPIIYHIYQGRNEVIQQLIDGREDLIYMLAPIGQTALHGALMMNNYSLLSTFIYAIPAAKVNTLNSQKQTVMDMAISFKDIEAVNILWNSWAFSDKDLERWIGIAASCAEEEWKELLTNLKRNRQLARAQCI
jgi:ankyrin repeat protein